MNRLILPILSTCVLLFFTACSSDRFEMDGIPEWVAGGAKLSSEPAPFKPDNTYLNFEDDSGPVEFTYITDKRRYPTPPEKKVEKKSTRDPLERGRDYRIKRLFR